MSEIPLALQTVYADLLDRAFNDAFADDFRANGTFVSKTRNGRRYWYFQSNATEKRSQKYVGPETPELLEEIEQHHRSHSDAKQRRAMVSSLLNSVSLPKPGFEMGEVLKHLAEAGAFRLRAVLVGTMAYQTYAAVLGVRLPAAAVLSHDVDIAQFGDISLAVEDAVTPPMLDILRTADPTFAAIPHIHDQRQATVYQARSGVRVDFLTPNQGPDTDEPQHLEALRTDAEPMRFLDFLIAEPIRAVILHGAGIPVLVPTPQRYAVHKLIVARRRRMDNAKIEKDLRQAAMLFEVLAERRPYDLKIAWNEAWERGPKWQQYLGEGLGQLPPMHRDIALRAIGRTRSIIPDLSLSFTGGRPHYDFDRHVVSFPGEAAGQRVLCRISREALADDFGADGEVRDRFMAAFQKNRRVIEKIAASKFLNAPVQDPNVVLVRTGDARNPSFASE